MGSERAVLVTGSSGFIGSRLVTRMAGLGWRVVAVDLRMPDSGVELDQGNVIRIKGDYADPQVLAGAFRAMEGSSSRAVCHFAAHYDFDLEWHSKYQATNVDGVTSLRDACVAAGMDHIVFASSMAVHLPPAPGNVITEDTVPDASIPYARSKILGEGILQACAERVPVTVLRIGGVFSPWCELPPLYGLLSLWLGPWPLSRAVLGRGKTAINYIHLDDLADLVVACVTRRDLLKGRRTLLACDHVCVDHATLFAAARPGVRSWSLSVPLARVGLHARNTLARLGPRMPFERPWMLKYADLSLAADNSRTCAMTGWRCRADRDILACMPELIRVAQGNPGTWHSRNRARCNQCRHGSGWADRSFST